MDSATETRLVNDPLQPLKGLEWSELELGDEAVDLVDDERRRDLRRAQARGWVRSGCAETALGQEQLLMVGGWAEGKERR